jgi:hypothetical protein
MADAEITQADAREQRRRALATAVVAKLRSASQNRRVRDVMQPYRCQRKGYQQKTGTCWFNAILNGLVMGQWTGALLLGMLQRMTPQGRKKLDLVLAEGVHKCPTVPNRIQILAHAAAYLMPGEKKIPRGVLPAWKHSFRTWPPTAHGGVDKVGSRAVNLILQTYGKNFAKTMHDGAYKRGVKVGGASRLLPILKQLFRSTEYRVVQARLLNNAEGLQRIAREYPNEKILIIEHEKWAPVSLFHPVGYAFPPKLGTYRLNNAHISLGSKSKTSGHSIAGYRCGDEDYIYDSAKKHASQRIVWSHGTLVMLEWFYHTRFNYVNVDYVCYVNAGQRVLPPPPSQRQPAARRATPLPLTPAPTAKRARVAGPTPDAPVTRLQARRRQQNAATRMASS